MSPARNVLEHSLMTVAGDGLQSIRQSDQQNIWQSNLENNQQIYQNNRPQCDVPNCECKQGVQLSRSYVTNLNVNPRVDLKTLQVAPWCGPEILGRLDDGRVGGQIENAAKPHPSDGRHAKVYDWSLEEQWKRTRWHPHRYLRTNSRLSGCPGQESKVEVACALRETRADSNEAARMTSMGRQSCVVGYADYGYLCMPSKWKSGNQGDNSYTSSASTDSKDRGDAGLAYYAYSKVRDVLSRDYFLQTIERDRLYFDNMMDFPDIMICSNRTMFYGGDSGHTILTDVTGRNITNSTFEIADETLPIYADICNDQQRLTILSTEGRNINVTQNSDELFVIFPNTVDVEHTLKEKLICCQKCSLTKRFTLQHVDECRMDFHCTKLNVLHHEWTSLYDDSIQLMSNATGVSVQIMNVLTYELRDDFWAYFGSIKPKPRRKVLTRPSSYVHGGGSRVDIGLPKFEMHYKQIPITSIPSAFADWGGAFSVVWGVFYILFGAPRLDPFGLIGILFMTKKSKRKIMRAYGPLQQKPEYPGGPDADGRAQRRMSTSSSASSMFSHATSPTIYQPYGSPPFPQTPSTMPSGLEHDPKQISIQQQLHKQQSESQQRLDERFRRLERMLSEFYLNMPADKMIEEEENEKRKSASWLNDSNPSEISLGRDNYNTNGGYFPADRHSADPYGDHIPLRGYDQRMMAREE
ncbi:hypothetical protein BG004_005628 [Podila humilis]|nr:hypothetical protein BG004_005628 [Podila humilis]